MDLIYRYDPYSPLDSPANLDADAAIETLRRGHERYARFVALIQREVLGGATAGPLVIPSDPLALGLPAASGEAPAQVPFALALGCSDARLPIERIFDQPPNSLFVIRVAGNVLGVECLGSIDYAVGRLGGSMKLLFVLGHSGCGAVTAAVDSYLAPRDYGEIALTHAVRSLLDRIQLAVRGAAHALERVCGAEVARAPGYRAALIEAAVYLNAALTAFDVRREVPSGPESPRVVYAVFDLVDQRVRPWPNSPAGDPPFGDVPSSPDEFDALGTRLAQAIVAKGLLD
ncbi:MAG TPA: carbonic anhydrase [Isosphaeraceae bacterium]|jgi:carbonic anhydrase|nr:carbonic anhydrase [Isosphaeraceae bacterium]